MKIVREVGSGRVAVFVDDESQPRLEAVDHRFRWGQIALGSFHETGDFDDITATGTRPIDGRSH